MSIDQQIALVPATTWQTVGPFFRIGLERLYEADIAGEGARGERIFVLGRVVDGMGEPVPDAVIEVWQANSLGRYAHPADTRNLALEPGFRGFGRLATDEQGHFRFTTVKPGPVPGPNSVMQAPHLVVSVMMRGLLRGLVTRAYFKGDAANDADPILMAIPPERRDTLCMRRSAERPDLLLWDIHMQGPNETVFLEF